MYENEKLLEKIAINIRSERFKQKLSQQNLSDLTGISINSISNIENAKQDTRISSLNAIADALNIKLSKLFE